MKGNGGFLLFGCCFFKVEDRKFFMFKKKMKLEVAVSRNVILKTGVVMSSVKGSAFHFLKTFRIGCFL